jgi:Glycosyl transferase family 2
MGGPAAVPVVMAVWRRVHLLERTLSRLSTQKGVRAEFHILNNNFDARAEVEQIAARFRSRLAITIVRRDNESGCFGRFLYMRQLSQEYPYIVVIDDDQLFDDDFLRTLCEDRIVGGIAGCHAFRFQRRKDYWHKQQLRAGQLADYCGPGGMIIDSRLLGSRRLLGCPRDYMMMDDIWLSYVIGHHLKAPMVRSAAMVAMTDLAGDTWHRIRAEKIGMLETLRDAGWEV